MGFGMGWVVDGLNYAVSYPMLIVLCILGYVALFGFSVAYSSRKRQGPNPFTRDTSRRPMPLVTDERARDRVLKQGFHVKRLPDKVDAIVIGSGMGGLTAANILARAGKKVLVLEQHDQAGGCCHTFVDKGFEFDVGIHYVGEMRNNTMIRLLVDQMTDGQLVWEDLDDVLDMVSIGEPGKAERYPICTGRGAWREALLQDFPNEKKAIDKFMQLIKEVRMNMLGMISLKVMPKWLVSLLIRFNLLGLTTNYFKYSQKTLKQTLDELTDNPKLKAVLAYSFGDYGTVPSKASFAMHAALINHYIFGGSYPRGGASEIAFHMTPPIERAGGKVIVRAKVVQILFSKRGRANGVRVNRGGVDIDLNAPLIISDAGISNTLMNLVPPEIACKSSIYPLLKENKVESGVGAMTVYVGLKGTAEELGLKSQNLWAFTGTDLDRLTSEYLGKSAEDAMTSEVPLLFISFPSTKDSTFNDRYPGKSVCTVVTLANWNWFKEWENERVMKRGFEYNKIKTNIGDRIWEQVVAHYPQLKDKVEFMDVGSPVSNKYYIASPKGEIYGLDHTVERFADPNIVMTLRPETNIPGLLLTGQDVFSCGFAGAMTGGVLCASKVLNRNVMQDLLALKKSISKNK